MKHYIKKIGILTLLCVLLLCSACTQKRENEQEKPEKQSLEDQQNTAQDEVTWSKHAFLLEDEDVFFASMPDNWKSVCRQYNGLVSIYFPTEGMLSQDQREEFCRLSVVKCQNTLKTLEDFTFADGQVGKKNGLKVYSADGKYGFVVESGTTNVQRREYMKCSEEFYESMIFQNAQIGLSQTESLKNRDKVRLHAYLGSLWLDVTVPEGIEFHTSDAYGDWLILNLDGGYVRVVYDPDQGETGEDFWEKRGKVLTDETYGEEAAYAVYNWNGYVCYLYGFIHPESIYAEIEVPEGDEEMLEAALDIVRSIRFR